MKIYVKWLFVILWMLLIFKFSSESGIESTETSQLFVNKILFLENIGIRTDIIIFLVRKSAHFFLYFVLGILVINASNGYKEYIMLSLLLCLFYASTDELHQLFVIGRSGELKDVLIDFIGSSAGIFLFSICKRKIPIISGK